jgi:hypothetical protein
MRKSEKSDVRRETQGADDVDMLEAIARGDGSDIKLTLENLTVYGNDPKKTDEIARLAGECGLPVTDGEAFELFDKGYKGYEAAVLQSIYDYFRGELAFSCGTAFEITLNLGKIIFMMKGVKQ